MRLLKSFLSFHFLAFLFSVTNGEFFYPSEEEVLFMNPEQSQNFNLAKNFDVPRNKKSAMATICVEINPGRNGEEPYYMCKRKGFGLLADGKQYGSSDNSYGYSPVYSPKYPSTSGLYGTQPIYQPGMERVVSNIPADASVIYREPSNQYSPDRRPAFQGNSGFVNPFPDYRYSKLNAPQEVFESYLRNNGPGGGLPTKLYPPSTDVNQMFADPRIQAQQDDKQVAAQSRFLSGANLEGNSNAPSSTLPGSSVMDAVTRSRYEQNYLPAQTTIPFVLPSITPPTLMPYPIILPPIYSQPQQCCSSCNSYQQDYQSHPRSYHPPPHHNNLVGSERNYAPSVEDDRQYKSSHGFPQSYEQDHNSKIGHPQHHRQHDQPTRIDLNSKLQPGTTTNNNHNQQLAMDTNRGAIASSGNHQNNNQLDQPASSGQPDRSVDQSFQDPNVDRKQLGTLMRMGQTMRNHTKSVDAADNVAELSPLSTSDASIGETKNVKGKSIYTHMPPWQ